MKRTLALLLSLTLLLTLCACARQQAPQDGDAMPTVLNTNEYVLYQNIFFNGQAGDYTGKTATKTGTFAILRDQFNEVDRYYVWGYYDATRCCDWQWEIKFDELPQLPPRGSRVTVKGVFTGAEEALDKYWITDPTVTVVEEYKSPYDCDVDMTTMSATLERVEQQNVSYKYEAFEGQSVAMYGRVAATASIQHPYYDGAWTQDFVSDSAEIPAIGTMVILTGLASGGVINDAKIEITDQF